MVPLPTLFHAAFSPHALFDYSPYVVSLFTKAYVASIIKGPRTDLLLSALYLGSSSCSNHLGDSLHL